jgi:hypothetical protein
VKVQGTDNGVIEYEGQHAVTLAMIDKIHKITNDTDRRDLTRNAYTSQLRD